MCTAWFAMLVFTKVMKPMVAPLGRTEHESYEYIDDSLRVERTAQRIFFTQRLGFMTRSQAYNQPNESPSWDSYGSQS